VFHQPIYLSGKPKTMMGATTTITTALFLAHWLVLPNAVVMSFVPPQAVVPTRTLSTRANLLSATRLLVAPNKDEDAVETSTALFSAVSPDSEEPSTLKPKPQDNNSNNNSMDLTALGAQVIAGLVAALVFLGVASLLMGMLTSAASALGNALLREAGNLLTHLLWALGALAGAIAGAAWEGTKVAAPALGHAVLEGAKAAAPIVEAATQAVTEAATPVLQEASRQVTEAAAPYVDSVSTAVMDPIREATLSVSSTVDSTIVAPILGTVDSVSNTVDSTIVAPIKDAADTVASTVESVNTKVDESLAPLRSLGDSIQGFKIF
jgi:hypothetical protein